MTAGSTAFQSDEFSGTPGQMISIRRLKNIPYKRRQLPQAIAVALLLLVETVRPIHRYPGHQNTMQRTFSDSGDSNAEAAVTERQEEPAARDMQGQDVRPRRSSPSSSRSSSPILEDVIAGALVGLVAGSVAGAGGGAAVGNAFDGGLDGAVSGGASGAALGAASGAAVGALISALNPSVAASGLGAAGFGAAAGVNAALRGSIACRQAQWQYQQEGYRPGALHTQWQAFRNREPDGYLPWQLEDTAPLKPWRPSKANDDSRKDDGDGSQNAQRDQLEEDKSPSPAPSPVQSPSERRPSVYKRSDALTSQMVVNSAQVVEKAKQSFSLLLTSVKQWFE